MFFSIVSSMFRTVRGACGFVTDTVSSLVSSSVVEGNGLRAMVLRQGVGMVVHVLVWRLFLWYFLQPFAIPAFIMRLLVVV